VKIQCGVRELIEALAIAASATAAKSAKQIMMNVFATANGSSLTLYGTDAEVSASVTLSVSCDGGGDFLIPTRRLSSILAELMVETVELTVTEKGIRIQSTGVDFRLSNESAAEYPSMSSGQSDKWFKISSVALKKLIQRTIFARDSNSTRYALGGVLFEVDKGELTCAATDSRRLAVCNFTVGGEVDLTMRGVIPVKILKMVDRIAPCELEVSITDNSIVFRSETMTFTSRVVEGRFPRWRDVVPKKFGIELNVMSHMAATAVRQAMVVTTEESRGVVVSLAEGLVTIKSQSSDVGSSDIELMVSAPIDAECSLTIDPKYVSDFLKCVPAEDLVYWRMNDADSAMMLTDGENFRYVIMPLAQDR